ncbi:hypothetical protein [Segetibacter sp.]
MAEGGGRNYKKDTIQFSHVARGSFIRSRNAFKYSSHGGDRSGRKI